MKVTLVGLGPIGAAVVDALPPSVRLVAAVDVAAAWADQEFHGVRVEADLAAVLQRGEVDAVILTTSSKLAGVRADLATAVAHGVHVVSTCEEMTDWPREDAALVALDAAAKKAGVTLLATGVNPGFVMDRLVLQLAGAQVSTASVRIVRHLDASKRRGPFRKKIGEGLTRAEFEVGKRDGWIGHVGLRQSAGLVARGLFGAIERYEETLDPVLSDDGKCLGLHQTARAWIGGAALIEMDLRMVVGQADPHDRVILVGDPPLDVRIANGAHGDRATIGAVLRALDRLPRAPRGLVTVADVFA